MAIFDKEAKNYDSWYDSKIGAFVDKVETDLALSLFKIEKGMKILDVGCGTGNFSIKLAELGCQVTAIDLSEGMLEEAKKKAKDKGFDIDFRKMDVYNLDLEDESFDGVFSMAAFEFIDQPEKAYKEMYRVLRPNGHMLIGTITRDGAWGQLYMSEDFQKNSVFKHAHLKTKEELIDLNRSEVKDQGECLFIGPMTDEEKVSLDYEKELSKTEKGGFACVLWEKGMK